MEAYNFFIDREGHLRSGWRLAIFVVAFLICLQITHVLLLVALSTALHRSTLEIGETLWGVAAGHGSILISALLIGWACGALLEDLPFAALGCSPHQGWFRNLLIGSALGVASLFFAALLTTLTRGTRFSFDPAGFRLIGETLFVSILVFLFAAAAEEMLFRGYVLQTLTRANIAWLGVVLTSVPFAAAHLRNPNVVQGFTFLNTALAGVWLAVAYLRTRSLWFPLGVHWSWNWALGSLFGLPVSGITNIAPQPLLHGVDLGPGWLTGGSYGIEGGVACTMTLAISTIFIWRTRLVSATEELKKLTSQENPVKERR